MSEVTIQFAFLTPLIESKGLQNVSNWTPDIKSPQNKNYILKSDKTYFEQEAFFSQTSYFTCRKIPNNLTGYKWEARAPLLTVFQKA